MMYTVYDYRLLAPTSPEDGAVTETDVRGTDPYVYLKKPSAEENVYLKSPSEFIKNPPFLPLK